MQDINLPRLSFGTKKDPLQELFGGQPTTQSEQEATGTFRSPAPRLPSTAIKPSTGGSEPPSSSGAIVALPYGAPTNVTAFTRSDVAQQIRQSFDALVRASPMAGPLTAHRFMSPSPSYMAASRPPLLNPSPSNAYPGFGNTLNPNQPQQQYVQTSEYRHIVHTHSPTAITSTVHVVRQTTAAQPASEHQMAYQQHQHQQQIQEPSTFTCEELPADDEQRQRPQPQPIAPINRMEVDTEAATALQPASDAHMKLQSTDPAVHVLEPSTTTVQTDGQGTEGGGSGAAEPTPVGPLEESEAEPQQQQEQPLETKRPSSSKGMNRRKPITDTRGVGVGPSSGGGAATMPIHMSGADHSEGVFEVTRFGRPRVKPLAYWSSERLVVGDKAAGATGIDRGSMYGDLLSGTGQGQNAGRSKPQRKSSLGRPGSAGRASKSVDQNQPQTQTPPAATTKEKAKKKGGKSLATPTALDADPIEAPPPTDFGFSAIGSLAALAAAAGAEAAATATIAKSNTPKATPPPRTDAMDPDDDQRLQDSIGDRGDLPEVEGVDPSTISHIASLTGKQRKRCGLCGACMRPSAKQACIVLRMIREWEGKPKQRRRSAGSALKSPVQPSTKKKKGSMSTGPRKQKRQQPEEEFEQRAEAGAVSEGVQDGIGPMVVDDQQEEQDGGGVQALNTQEAPAAPPPSKRAKKGAATSTAQPTSTEGEGGDDAGGPSNGTHPDDAGGGGGPRRSTRQKVPRKKVQQGPCEGGDGEEEEEEDVWSPEQEQALQHAWLVVPPTAPNFWQTVAGMVPGKSASQCFSKMYERHPTPRGKKQVAGAGAQQYLAAARGEAAAPEFKARASKQAIHNAARKMARQARWKQRAEEVVAADGDEEDLVERMEEQAQRDKYIDQILRKRRGRALGAGRGAETAAMLRPPPLAGKAAAGGGDQAVREVEAVIAGAREEEKDRDSGEESDYYWSEEEF